MSSNVLAWALLYAFCWLLKEEQERLETAILEYVIFQGSSLSP